MGLGISLRALMNARKQNVAQIAAASGMDAQKVYYILKHDPISGDMSALKRLADAYGITLEYFVNPDLEEAAREAQLLDHFRQTDATGRKKIVDYSADMQLLYRAQGA